MLEILGCIFIGLIVVVVLFRYVLPIIGAILFGKIR